MIPETDLVARLRYRLLELSALMETEHWKAAVWEDLLPGDSIMLREAADALTRLSEWKEAGPTQFAYDAACAALEKHRKRADEAEAEVRRLRDELLEAKLAIDDARIFDRQIDDALKAAGAPSVGSPLQRIDALGRLVAELSALAAPITTEADATRAIERLVDQREELRTKPRFTLP